MQSLSETRSNFMPRLVIASLLVFAVVLVMAAVRHTRPVLLKFAFEDTLRPRTHCVMNPFRERGPERVCESYLAQLHSGRVEGIRPFVLKNRADHIISRESQYRIASWRIGDRQDSSTASSLMYWVRRAGGYGPDEEEVMFFLKRDRNGWALSDFTAIY
jgi:hypothetical protein